MTNDFLKGIKQEDFDHHEGITTSATLKKLICFLTLLNVGVVMGSCLVKPLPTWVRLEDRGSRPSESSAGLKCIFVMDV